jgi:hypothetical protein
MFNLHKVARKAKVLALLCKVLTLILSEPGTNLKGYSFRIAIKSYTVEGT